MLEIGQRAPSFSLSSTAGRNVSLDDLRGRKLVLYFYPKDDTPGCTQEACDFRDNLARFRSAGAQLFGVSKDSLASHAKFRGKHELPFDLLSDEQNAVAKTYGAYGRKNMYGKQVEGTIRSTFLIDEDGRIERIWSPVKVAGHVESVLQALRGGIAPTRITSKLTNKPRARTSAPALKSPRKPQAKSQPKSTAKDSAKKVAQRSKRKTAVRKSAHVR